MNFWHLPKAPVRYCSIHRLAINCANMQAIMLTVMPRNRIISVMASVPSSRNALTQEDCITTHRAEKRWKTPTGPSSAQSPRYRVVPNAQFRAPQRNASPGRLVFRPPQQQGGYRPPVPPQQPQQFGPRPNNQQFQQGSSTYRCFNCGSADHFIKDCPQPRKPLQRQSSDQNN
jgi:hypothetical protein